MHPNKVDRPVTGISVYVEDCDCTGVSNQEAAFFPQGVGVIN